MTLEERAREEFQRALEALYLEVPFDVARDVRQKAEAALIAAQEGMRERCAAACHESAKAQTSLGTGADTGAMWRYSACAGLEKAIRALEITGDKEVER